MQGDLALACCAALQLTPPADAHGNGVVALQHVLDAAAAKHSQMPISKVDSVVVPSSQDSEGAAFQLVGSAGDTGVVGGSDGTIPGPAAVHGVGVAVGSTGGFSAFHADHNIHNSVVDGSNTSTAAADGGTGVEGSGTVASRLDEPAKEQQVVGEVQAVDVVQQVLIPVVSAAVLPSDAAGGAAAATGHAVKQQGGGAGLLQGMPAAATSVDGSVEQGMLPGAEWVSAKCMYCNV